MRNNTVGDRHEKKGSVEMLSIRVLGMGMSKLYIRVVGVISFSLLTAVGAHIYIPLPFTPVPITLQTFFVLSSGAVLGSNLGMVSQLSYVILGIFGLPMFSQGYGGFERILGPTGGYIIGFIISSYIVGKIVSSRKTNLLKTILGFIIGAIIIYFCGVVHLASVMNYSIEQAIIKGVLPFIYGDFIKVVVLVKLYNLYRLRALSSVGRAAGS